MTEKPPTGDTEQRRKQTEAARHQSGLPPEDAEQTSHDETHRGVQRDVARDQPTDAVPES